MHRTHITDLSRDAVSVVGLIAAEHLLMREREVRLSRPHAFALGIATFGAHLLRWCVAHRDATAIDAFVAFVVLAGAAGATTTALYHRLDRRIAVQLRRLSQEAPYGRDSGRPERGL